MAGKQTVGKAFRIGKKDVRGYGYVDPPSQRRMRRNPPGVSAIAAINGPGAYRRHVRSAREAMAGLSANKRRARARTLTRAEGSAFASRMAEAKSRKAGDKMRRNRQTPAQKRASLRNLAKGRRKQRGGRLRKNTASLKRRAVRRRPLRANPKKRRATRKTAPKRRLRANAAKRRKTTTRKRRTLRRNAPKRRMSKAARSAAAKKGWRKRKSLRRNAPKRRTTAKRRRAAPRKRRSLRRNAPKRRTSKAARSAAARKGWRKRKSMRRNAPKRRATSKRRRATPKRRSLRRNAPKRRTSKAARSAAARKGWRKRRGLRRNAPKRRTTSKRRRAAPKRRSMRRNTGKRRMFRRNQGAVETAKAALMAGALITGGLVAEKVLAKVLTSLVLDKVLGDSQTGEPAAVTGLGAVEPYKNILAGVLAASAGLVATHYVVKDSETKALIAGGMVAGLLHTVVVAGLSRMGEGSAAGYLAGADDAMAARLSAMTGFGASLQPRYAQVAGLGRQAPFEAYAGAPGMGEYFESGVEGMGNYMPNDDIQQAAAGFGGADDDYQGTHISPASDLDRQLSIAEAAAGVGAYPQIQQAAAGMGEYFRQPVAGMGEYFRQPVAGLGEYLTRKPDGSVVSAGRADTWVPGTSDPQLWAGTREVQRLQESTAMTPAGIISTAGGDGIFG